MKKPPAEMKMSVKEFLNVIPATLLQPMPFLASLALLALTTGAPAQQTKPQNAGDDAREITNSIGMKLRLIPSGVFMMGSPGSEKNREGDEGPQHRVRITEPFYMGVHEVTVGQFRRFVADTGYKTDGEKDGTGGWGFDGNTFSQKPEYNWRDPGLRQTDEHPVVNVSWNDAVAFCEWLSHKEGNTYRLPTEAQWEYACRSGTTTPYHHGDDDKELVQMGNVADSTAKEWSPAWEAIDARDGFVFTAPVGRFRPNAFGLHDMIGNVCEWCDDWYAEGYYAASPEDDPGGPAQGSIRVNRGSSWFGLARFCRSADRDGSSPHARVYVLGFRVTRAASAETPLTGTPIVHAHGRISTDWNTPACEYESSATERQNRRNTIPPLLTTRLAQRKRGTDPSGDPDRFPVPPPAPMCRREANQFRPD